MELLKKRPFSFSRERILEAGSRINWLKHYCHISNIKNEFNYPNCF